MRNRLALWISIFVFPPLGLVLLWIRGDLGVLRRIAGTLAIGALAVAELFLVYGMRIVWNGNMSPITVTFASRTRHDAQIEASRASQRTQTPVTAPAEPTS